MTDADVKPEVQAGEPSANGVVKEEAGPSDSKVSPTPPHKSPKVPVNMDCCCLGRVLFLQSWRPGLFTSRYLGALKAPRDVYVA